MALLNPHQHDHDSHPENGTADPAATTNESLQDPGVSGSFYSVPESTAGAVDANPDDVSGFSADTLTQPTDEAPEYAAPTEETPAVEASAPAETAEPAQQAAPEKKMWPKIFAPVVAVGVLTLGALGLTKKGGDEGQQVNSGPVPTAANPTTPPPAPTLEAPKPSADLSKTTITVKQPVIDPSVKHFPMRESAKGTWPRDEFTEQGLGDFRMSATTQDLNTFGYNTSKRYKGSQESLEVTDGSRQLVITVDARDANSIIGIRLSSSDASTDESIKVGSSKADLEKAYAGKLQTEQMINVDGEAEEGYVYVNPRGHKFIFELDSSGNVDAINLRNPDFF